MESNIEIAVLIALGMHTLIMMVMFGDLRSRIAEVKTARLSEPAPKPKKKVARKKKAGRPKKKRGPGRPRKK